MAATVSTTPNAWSKKPGAWALDAEEHEEELIQEQKTTTTEKENNNGHLTFSANRLQKQEQSEFPTLSAAVTTKTKKKKPVAVPLSEFTTGKQVTHGSANKYQPARGLTTDELLVLPTGPRERTAEELERSSSRLGGGFRSFDGRSSREDSSSRWGSDESKRGGSFNRGENSRESGPSRADETDDWGAAKKSSMGAPAFERRERGGGTGGGFFDSQSRADDSDSWVSNKSRVAASGPPRRVSGGGGFENSRERRGGFEFQKESSNGGGADSDTWGKKREEGTVTERPRLMLQPKTVSATTTNGEQQQQQELGSGTTGKSKGSNPFGEARPREEVLAEKGQDWKKIDEQLESVKIKEMGTTEQLEPLKIKEATRSTNPFGEARPREEVLAEKGQDWKKIDEQLESAKIKEMGSADVSSFGSKPLSNGNGRVKTPPEHRAERSWRKPEPVGVAPPSSAEKVEENGAVHSAEQVQDAAVEAEN